MGSMWPIACYAMLVIRHLHLFEVPYREKQAICKKLDIPYTQMVIVDPRRKLLPRKVIKA